MLCGFIGAGVIASAVIRGVIGGRAAKPGDINVYDILTEKAVALGGELGLTVCDSAEQLVMSSDAVFLAVKPDKSAQVLNNISAALKEKKPLLISVVAGKTFDFLDEAAGAGLPIARVIPNTNAAVLESMSVICFNGRVSEPQKEAVVKYFSACGAAYVCAGEGQMGVLSCLCGCSPAYAFMFIDSLAKAAHKAGIDKKTAVSLAAQAVLGSAKTVLVSGLHPAQLADDVCSPGGTTIEGVCELDERGFSAAVTAALGKAIDKNGRI